MFQLYSYVTICEKKYEIGACIMKLMFVVTWNSYQNI